MKVSDELKHAIEIISIERGPNLNLSHLMGEVNKAIPRVVTLERCKELLEQFRWRSTSIGDVCQWCHVNKDENRHTDKCEIAKVLED